MIRHALIFWSAVLLAVFGFVSTIITKNWGQLSGLLIPLLLLAVVFYLYKFPPRRFGGGGGGPKIKVKPSQKTMEKVAGIRKSQTVPGKRKSYPFQVIEGSKGKNDEQLPKYH